LIVLHMFTSARKQEKFFELLRQGTETYLSTVIEDKGSNASYADRLSHSSSSSCCWLTVDFSDLQTTRNQINRCFQTIDCFLLPHPGIISKLRYRHLPAKLMKVLCCRKQCHQEEFLRQHPTTRSFLPCTAQRLRPRCLWQWFASKAD
jgi:hypothetical protein